MTVPVLFVIFNRPDLTRRSMQALLAAQPELLLVAADGPRGDHERELCERTRNVIEQASPQCPVQKNFSDTNLGCGVRVRSAIDWALSMHESVIVIEDDCIVAPSFLNYCRELLVHYRDDERIMHISGNNFWPDRDMRGASYRFSKYTHAWGWATWRRAWRHNDWTLSRWPQLRADDWLRRCCDDPLEREYWTGVFDSVCGGARDIWDYQWMFSCWLNNGLTVIPRVNLVSNVGMGDDATHTKGADRFFDLPMGDLQQIEHPSRVERDLAADRIVFDSNFEGAEMRRQRSLRVRLRRRFPWLAPPLRAARALIARYGSGSR